MLIGSFRNRQHAGRPRSAKHAKQDWPNIALGHWPESLKVKRDCVVCSKYWHVHHILLVQGRHESADIARCTFVSTVIDSATNSTIILWNFGGSLFYLDSMFASLFHHTHIYLCFTELNMCIHCISVPLSLCLSLHIAVSTVNCCSVH